MKACDIQESIKRLDRMMIIALFGAFCIFLSSIEYLIPRPVPFFRYGLANIAILLVIRVFSFKDILLLSMIKVLGLGILNGTFASYVFVFSLLGTLGAVCSMWGVQRVLGKRLSLLGISVVGALFSNLIQIACAVLYVFGVQAWVIAPYLLLLGMIASVFIGILAQIYWNKSSVLEQIFLNYNNRMRTNRTEINR